MVYMNLSRPVKRLVDLPRCGFTWPNEKRSEPDHLTHACIRPVRNGVHVSRGGISGEAKRHRCACGRTLIMKEEEEKP